MPVTEEDLVQEAHALIGKGDLSQARSSLLVFIRLFPDSARLNYDFWKACCLARDDSRANALFGETCQNDMMLSRFCELLLMDLRRVVAGHSEEGNFVRSGILIPSKASVEIPLQKCLALLLDNKQEEDDDGAAWKILLLLGKLTNDNATLWWRACEFTYELDEKTRRSKMAEEPFSMLCTEWSKLLATECIEKVMKGRQLGEDELVRIQPYIERAVLHHFGLGDWVGIRALIEFFVGCCPPEVLKSFPLRNVPLANSQRPAAGASGKQQAQQLVSSRLVSTSVSNTVCQSLSSKSSLGDLHPVVAYLCLLGSYHVDLLKYSLFCRYGSEDVVSLNASHPSLTDAHKLIDSSHEGTSMLSGWFFLPPIGSPQETGEGARGGGDETTETALGKRGRGSAEDNVSSALTTAGANGWRKDIQMSLSRQLRTLSSIWEAFMDPAIQGLASDHVKMQSKWGAAFSQLNDVMLHISWQRNEKKDVEERLEKMHAFPSLSPIEKAKTKLQKMVFTEASKKSKIDGCLSDSLREILQEVVSSGHANKLQWYENDDYNDIFTAHSVNDRYSLQHFPLVPTSRYDRPTLARFQGNAFSRLQRRVARDAVPCAHTARGGNEKQIASTRQLLEKQMSGLGKEAAGTFTVSSMLEKLLALNGRRGAEEDKTEMIQ
eukprot:765878-Hanusia_phi.AAC.11